MQPVGQATCKERLDCRQPDSVPHGRVRRKDVQYEEIKSLSGHRGRCRRVTEYLWWETHRNVSPEEAPSVNHQPWEGAKRRLCCDAAPQEVSSRNQLLAWRVPYVMPLKITQSWLLSVRISQKRCSTGMMQPPMAWFGTTCLKDWPQLGSVPHALCSYTQPLWSHTA